jgi:hypothetical protein
MRRFAPALVLAVSACGSPVAELEEACFELPQAALTGNGQEMQGDNLNGVQLQGDNLNGDNLNGDNLNGDNLNGSNLNGVQIQGVSLQGTNLNGIETNGAWQNGVWQNGTWLNGTNLNGTNLNGTNLNGTGLDATTVDVRLDGGRLVVEANGKRLKEQALVGATLFARDGDVVIPLKIESIERDANDARLAFYVLSVEGAPVCSTGNERGVFVAGSFDATGGWLPDASKLSYACNDGVMNKCVRWGYTPWAAGDDAYQTCTRMARADYCGDGVPWTQNGTMIDLFDDFGVQERAGVEGFTFEAGWSIDGAVCVNAPRYAVHDAAGTDIRPSCWDALPRCDSFDRAQDLGALLGNDSAHTEITACN